MTIANMMQHRAALDATLDAIPGDLSREQEFKDIFDREWQIKQTILGCRATTLDAIKQQIRILAQRAHDVGDTVAEELERLAR
jgi:hypothetical protein